MLRRSGVVMGPGGVPHPNLINALRVKWAFSALLSGLAFSDQCQTVFDALTKADERRSGLVGFG